MSVCTLARSIGLLRYFQTTDRLPNTIASFPGLLTPAFVACSTNAGEGLVKLVTPGTNAGGRPSKTRHVQVTSGRNMNIWRSGTFLRKPQGRL